MPLTMMHGRRRYRYFTFDGALAGLAATVKEARVGMTMPSSCRHFTALTVFEGARGGMTMP